MKHATISAADDAIPWIIGTGSECVKGSLNVGVCVLYPRFLVGALDDSWSVDLTASYVVKNAPAVMK